MNLHENSTMLDRFVYYMEQGKEKKAKQIEIGYNFLEDCFDLEISFQPVTETEEEPDEDTDLG